MSGWLESSVKYYREQAENARRSAAKLRDPKRVEREISKRQVAVEDAELKLRFARESLAWIADDEAREHEAGRYDDSAARWDALAKEHGDYAERKEAGLFEEVDA